MKFNHIAIVLVRPKSAGNIGSVCRAMKNTGLSRLILIDPCDYLNDEAKKMAVGDRSILGKARVYSDLKKALKPFHWTIATTRRARRRFNEEWTPKDIAQRIVHLPDTHKVALVFGPEDMGLSNEEISLCQAMLTIPSHPKFPSLNLAQAVMVCVYEIYCASLSNVCPSSKEDLASMEALEGMYQHLQKVLTELKYFSRGKPGTLMESIRNFLGRARLGARDVRILRGVFSTIQRRVSKTS